jgi:hypothetical protein
VHALRATPAVPNNSAEFPVAQKNDPGGDPVDPVAEAKQEQAEPPTKT